MNDYIEDDEYYLVSDTHNIAGKPMTTSELRELLTIDGVYHSPGYIALNCPEYKERMFYCPHKISAKYLLTAGKISYLNYIRYKISKLLIKRTNITEEITDLEKIERKLEDEGYE